MTLSRHLDALVGYQLARWEAGRQSPDLERQHDVVRRLRALTRLQRNRR
jgi:hypothetical protein